MSHLEGVLSSLYKLAFAVQNHFAVDASVITWSAVKAVIVSTAIEGVMTTFAFDPVAGWSAEEIVL